MNTTSLNLIGWLLAIALGVALLVSGTSPLWWIGAGLVAATVTHATLTEHGRLTRWWGYLSEPRTLGPVTIKRPRVWLIEAGATGVFLALAAIMMPEAAMGNWPTDHDHPVHLFKAWQLWESFLSDGRLVGWSDRWFAGYPAQYLYPIGTDLWVLLVRGLSLGTLTLGAAYGVAVWLFWAMQGWATYLFATRGFSRVTGLLAGALVMMDTAAFRFGGWTYTIEWGVWPQSLSLSWALLSLACLPTVLQRRSWKAVGGFGLLMGIALITHPVQLLFYAAAVAVVPIALWAAPHARDRLAGLTRFGASLGLGGLIGAMWILPFLTVRDTANSYGQEWINARDMGNAFYDLSVLPGTWALVTALGLIGVVALFWARRFVHVFTALMAVVLLTGASSTFLDQLHLVDLSSSFVFIQFERFSILLKPFYFIAAAYALVAAFRYGLVKLGAGGLEDDGDTTGAESLQRPRRWRDHPYEAALRVLVIVTLMAPVIVHWGEVVGTKHFKRDLVEESVRPYRAQRADFVKWANATLTTEPHQRWRMLFVSSRHDHSFVDMGMRVDFPIYKEGFTPASNFQYKMESRDKRILKAVGVRYALSVRRRLPSRDWKPMRSFGDLHVYEFKHWTPEPFTVVDGGAEVEVTRLDPEEIVMEVAPGASGILRLQTSYFPRWHASHNGEDIPITALSVEGDDRTGFISVSLSSQGGTYRFTFERSVLDRVAPVVGLLGILVSLILMLGVGRERGLEAVWRLLERIIERLELFERERPLVVHGAFGAVIAGILIGVTALASWTPPLAKDHFKDWAEPLYDFTENLSNAHVWETERGRTQRCVRIFDTHDCRGPRWEDVYPWAFIDSDAETWRRCIWTHPREDGPVVLKWKEVPSGSAMRGFYTVHTSSRTNRNAPVNFKIAIDGAPAFAGATKRDNVLETFDVALESTGGDAVEVQVEVSARKDSWRHFCFHAQMVE